MSVVLSHKKRDIFRLRKLLLNEFIEFIRATNMWLTEVFPHSHVWLKLERFCILQVGEIQQYDNMIIWRIYYWIAFISFINF